MRRFNHFTSAIGFGLRGAMFGVGTLLVAYCLPPVIGSDLLWERGVLNCSNDGTSCSGFYGHATRLGDLLSFAVDLGLAALIGWMLARRSHRYITVTLGISVLPWVVLAILYLIFDLSGYSVDEPCDEPLHPCHPAPFLWKSLVNSYFLTGLSGPAVLLLAFLMGMRKVMKPDCRSSSPS